MKTKPVYLVMVRPVRSACWTVERIASSQAVAERLANEERNRKIRFANGSVHLQSTAIICAQLPEDRDETQQHFDSEVAATVVRGIP